MCQSERSYSSNENLPSSFSEEKINTALGRAWDKEESEVGNAPKSYKLGVGC